LARGNCQVCLHEFEPRAGDCVLIEAGTVHALGAGLLIAEIQQASDTTYRLFDWNRLGQSGQPRPLHIRQALDTIDYSRGPVNPVSPTATDDMYVERLVRCDKFVLDRWRFNVPRELPDDECFHILAVTEGQASLNCENGVLRLRRGDTVLVPATTRGVEISPQANSVLLDIYLP